MSIATLKTDNAADVGMHCFEKAGLGIAPFRIIGFTTMKFQAAPGASVQPGTSCDYCGTGIMYVCLIQDRNGKQFKVGCDCVGRTGDAGLIKAYKSTKEYRAHQKALRDAKDDMNRAEIERFLADDAFCATLAGHPFTTSWGKEDNLLNAAQRSLPWCGAKGRSEWLRTFKKLAQERE